MAPHPHPHPRPGAGLLRGSLRSFITGRSERCFSGHRCTQRGQATIEYLYVIPILLLLLLASLQFVFIYEAKQTLNYATFMATRAGALNNGSMASIQDGLASGLAPLFAHDLVKDTSDPYPQLALKNARKAARAELIKPELVRIQIVNPTSGALSGFGSSGEIPNDNLMYRDPDIMRSGMNIQDANLLKVRVTYCVRLIVPVVNRLIYSYAVSPAPTPATIDSYNGGATSAANTLKVATGTPSGFCIDTADPAPYPYRIPVTSEAIVRMQSPFKDPGATLVSGIWTAP